MFTEAGALLCHFSLCQGASHVLLLMVCLLSVSVCVVFVAAMLLVKVNDLVTLMDNNEEILSLSEL
jgi:hypothetical protein